MTRRERANFGYGLFFIAPWIIGLSVFTLAPAAMAFYYSLTDFSVLLEPIYIGTDNYKELVADDLFWLSLRNTLFYAALSLPLDTLLSLALAILLNQKIIARPVFRTIFFLPTLVPLVAVAILWQWIFNGQYGVLNEFLNMFGIEGPNWLSDPQWIKPALVVTGLWGVGQAIVIYLAGLQDVPRHLYESADIDGAGWWMKTRHITLPLISPVIYFNLIMGSIGILQEFITPYVMLGAEGGTARAGLFYTMYLFNHAFTHLNMGYACAMGVILFVMIASLTLLVHSLSIRHVHYGGA